MEVSMHNHTNPIKTSVRHIPKDEETEGDYDLYIISFIQSDSEVKLYFRGFGDAYEILTGALLQLGKHYKEA